MPSLNVSIDEALFNAKNNYLIVICDSGVETERVFAIPYSYLRREVLPKADLYKGSRYYFNVNKINFEFNWQHGVRMNGTPFLISYIESAVKEKPNVESQSIVNDLADVTIKSVTSSPQLTDSNGKVLAQSHIFPRSDGFRIGVRSLYRDSCAVCGSKRCTPDGTPEVESAHIYPKRLDGSDDLRNGIALCRFHHWAFDCGWFSIANNLSILLRNDLPAGEDYIKIIEYQDRKIAQPINPALTPHSIYLAEHRRLHGFE